MSALGQKRTFAVHQPMSALPPKADIPTRDVSCQRLVQALLAARCERGYRRKRQRSRWSGRGHNPNDTSVHLQRDRVQPQSDLG
jgi:hypothetical protein